MTLTAIPGIRRNCNLREAGSVYIAGGKRKDSPDKEKEYHVDFFSICPPWEVDLEELGISSQGIYLRERPDGSGVFDIYDYVGASMYTLADFMEEGNHDDWGFSRKIAKSVLHSAEFKRITQASKHLLIHPHAVIDDPQPFYNDRLIHHPCPKNIDIHNENKSIDTCLGLAWEHDMLTPRPKRSKKRVHDVEMPRNAPEDDVYPHFSYEVAWAPIPRDEIVFRPAIFMWEPPELEVIEAHDGSHWDAVRLIEEAGTGLPYTIMEA